MLSMTSPDMCAGSAYVYISSIICHALISCDSAVLKKVKAVLLWRTFGRVYIMVLQGGPCFQLCRNICAPVFLGVAAPLYTTPFPMRQRHHASLAVCISIARKMANFDAKYMCRGFVGLCS